MPTRSHQLQIRVTPAEKARLRRLAAAAGQDMSSYILGRALPPDALRFARLVAALREDEDRRFVLAELNDFLTALAPVQFTAAVGEARLSHLSTFLQNYLAAMVEQAAMRKGVAPPRWVAGVAPLDAPHFGAPLERLRPWLLRAAPVAFKRRNLFVDASVGDRV